MRLHVYNASNDLNVVSKLRLTLCFFLFFVLSFLSSFSFTRFKIHRTAGERRDYLFDSSLLLPPVSQTLRHYPGNYCKELPSAHSKQGDSSRESFLKIKDYFEKMFKQHVLDFFFFFAWCSLTSVN